MLLASHELAAVERLAVRVGFLDHGRLRLDEELEALRGRWRRLRLPPAEAAETAALCAGLAPWRPQTPRTTAWGREIVFEAFSPEAATTESLAALVDAAEPLSLEEIFVATVGESPTWSTV